MDGYNEKTKQQLIQELIQKEEELTKMKLYEERYKTLYHKAPLGYQSLDSQGFFVDVNEQWVKMLGYTPEEVLGKWFGDFLAEDYKDRFRENFPKFKAKGEIQTEFEMLCKNGQKVFIAFDGKIGYTNQGEFKQTHCILKDVTDKKIAETKLADIRELLRETEINGKIGGWVINFANMTQTWTDEIFRIHELDFDFEPMFENTLTFWSEESQPIIKDAIKEAYTLGKPFNLELELITAKNNKKWINVIGVPVVENEVITKVRGSFQDITERKRAEISLKQSEYLYRILTENIKDIVWILDVDIQRFIYVSPSIKALSGYTPKEIMESPIEKFLTPESTLRFYSMISERVKEFELSGVETSEFYIDQAEQVNKDGSIVFTELISSYYRNKDNNHIEIRGVTRDITERKENENKINALNKHFKALIEKAPDGIALIDKEGRFKYASPSALKIFGYDVAESIRFHPDEMTHPDDLNMVLNELGKLIDNPTYVPTIEYRFKSKSGQWIWIESSFTNLLSDPNVEAIIINFREITDRKLYEEKLTEEKVRAQQYINIAGVVLLSLDRGGKVVLINKSGCELLEYPENEIVGQNWYDKFLPAEEKNTVKGVSKKVYSGDTETVKYFENAILTKSGKRRLVAWHNSFLHDANGNIIGTLSSGEDITERKALELERLKLSEAVSQSANTIVITDDKGIIEYVNPKFTELTGYTQEEAIGNNPRILNSGMQPKVYYSYMWQTIKSGKSWKGEFHNKRKNGTLFWEQVTISPLKNEQGKIINFLAIKEDITKRKESQELLKQEKHFSNSLINSLPGIFYLFTFPELKLVRWNNNFEKELGYNSDELNRLDVNDLFLPDQKNKVYEAINFAIEENQVSIEASLIGKDGRTIPYILSGVGVNLFGKQYLVGVGIDNTEQLEATAELNKAKEKAEESDRLKSAFLANMSHEVRTPMNGILGFAGLLKDQELNGEQQKHYIQIIEKSGIRMLNIINDIIDISKIEAGQMTVSYRETNVNEQITFIYEFFKPEITQKQVGFVLNKGLQNAEVNINTDKEKLYAVLTNLVKNAIKFTDTGLIELGYIKKGNFLEFYVKDTGKGIDAEHKKLIFERFRQGNESNTRNYEGAGLGLSISKAYVEMLGGTMWVESEVHKGSTFYFTLPCK